MSYRRSVVVSLAVCVLVQTLRFAPASAERSLAEMFTPEQEKNMKAFPPAEAGMVRYVLPVPEAPEEHVLKVELEIGKTVEVDAVNKHFFTGKLETETVKGWGFHYHIVKDVGVIAGSRMAPLPGAPKVNKFVRLGGDPELLRYNSRLPLVVYVPEGVEVRYSIWRRDAESQPVPQA